MLFNSHLIITKKFQDFQSLKEIASNLTTRIEETFSYILNSNDPNFEPIYLEASYLNPINISQTLLTDMQMKLADELFQMPKMVNGETTNLTSSVFAYIVEIGDDEEVRF